MSHPLVASIGQSVAKLGEILGEHEADRQWNDAEIASLLLPGRPFNPKKQVVVMSRTLYSDLSKDVSLPSWIRASEFVSGNDLVVMPNPFSFLAEGKSLL